jgi:glycosyltransferase involved in cell wall biosynthesis
MLKIAQVSPLYESVPPQTYGGTERVVSYLTEALVALGHQVTLFASGDSQTTAELVPVCPRSLRLDPESVDSLAHHMLMIERVAQRADDFDIVHFHVDYVHYPVTRRVRCRHVTTLHGRLDLTDLQPLYDEFADVPLVSISNSQRTPLPQAHWVATVHHGLPLDRFALETQPEDYLAFLGRISPEKRVDRAIEIARRVGLPLRVAAKIDAADRAYFAEQIAPLFELPFVEYVGEIDEAGKQAFLGRARALLFPIDWCEPFGLVMTEAMACGTPVVAWRHGSVPEIMTDGVTGFIVEDIGAAVEATHRALTLDRASVRRVFEARFSAERMARDYVAVYQALLQDKRPRPVPRLRVERPA